MPAMPTVEVQISVCLKHISLEWKITTYNSRWNILICLCIVLHNVSIQLGFTTVTPTRTNNLLISRLDYYQCSSCRSSSTGYQTITNSLECHSTINLLLISLPWLLHASSLRALLHLINSCVSLIGHLSDSDLLTLFQLHLATYNKCVSAIRI